MDTRDKRIQSTARVAPATIAKVGRTVPAARNVPARRRQPRTTAPVGPVETVKVDRRIMAAARRLARGDMTRVEILSPTEVRVRNNGRAAPGLGRLAAVR